MQEYNEKDYLLDEIEKEVEKKEDKEKTEVLTSAKAVKDAAFYEDMEEENSRDSVNNLNYSDVSNDILGLHNYEVQNENGQKELVHGAAYTSKSLLGFDAGRMKNTEQEKLGCVWDNNPEKRFKNNVKRIVNSGRAVPGLAHVNKSLDDIGYVAELVFQRQNLEGADLGDFTYADMRKFCDNLADPKKVRHELRDKFNSVFTETENIVNGAVQKFNAKNAGMTKEEKKAAGKIVKALKTFTTPKSIISNKTFENDPLRNVTQVTDTPDHTDGLKEKMYGDALQCYARLKGIHESRSKSFKFWSWFQNWREGKYLQAMEATLKEKLGMTDEELHSVHYDPEKNFSDNISRFYLLHSDPAKAAVANGANPFNERLEKIDRSMKSVFEPANRKPDHDEFIKDNSMEDHNYEESPVEFVSEGKVVVTIRSYSEADKKAYTDFYLAVDNTKQEVSLAKEEAKNNQAKGIILEKEDNIAEEMKSRVQMPKPEPEVTKVQIEVQEDVAEEQVQSNPVTVQEQPKKFDPDDYSNEPDMYEEILKTAKQAEAEGCFPKPLAAA